MIETIILALLIAKIRGYKLKPLFKEWAIYPVLFFTVIYLYMEYTIFHGEYGFLRYTTLFKSLYFGMFAVLVLVHRQYIAGFIGAASLVIGGALNNIVINANGGKMPVFPTLSYITGYVKPDTFERATSFDSLHVLGSSTSRLAYLADRIDLGYVILSMGDVFTHLMAFVIIYSLIRHLNHGNPVVVSEAA